MEDQKILFLLHIPESLPPIYADPLKLKEALLNLLRNAQEALGSAPADHSNKEISLYAEYSEHSIHLHVRDNGTGIPSEYMDTIFDPFVTHKPAGTGLGLGIVKEIAKHHNGTVAITTNACPPNTYTDVCITIPAALS